MRIYVRWFDIWVCIWVRKRKESIFKHSVKNGKTGEYVNEKFTKMINILQDKNSAGADSITQEEQITLYEFMLNITGHNHVYSY